MHFSAILGHPQAMVPVLELLHCVEYMNITKKMSEYLYKSDRFSLKFLLAG
jgi:hypothetical protein